MVSGQHFPWLLYSVRYREHVINWMMKILSKCEVVLLNVAASIRRLWLVDSIIMAIIYSVRYTCRQLSMHWMISQLFWASVR